MGSLQKRQRPRSSSQLSTGMLSYQRIVLPQRGQWDGGDTTDSSCGQRSEHTLRNDPKARPKSPATDGHEALVKHSVPPSRHTTGTGERVEENRAGDACVQ